MTREEYLQARRAARRQIGQAHQASPGGMCLGVFDMPERPAGVSWLDEFLDDIKHQLKAEPEP